MVPGLGGMFIANTGNKPYPFTGWVSYPEIVSGLGDVGYLSSPAIHKINNTLYLLSSENTTTVNAWAWNGSSWIANSTIKSGLSFSDGSQPIVFDIDDVTYLVLGLDNISPYWSGYYWNGSSWSTHSGIASGLATHSSGNQFLSMCVLNLDGNLKCIAHNRYGQYKGYSWNGVSWSANSSIISGLPSVYTHEPIKSTVLQADYTYLIIGEFYGGFYGYKWENNSWVESAIAKNSLTDVGYRATPCVFYLNGHPYLIIGSQDGQFKGYKAI